VGRSTYKFWSQTLAPTEQNTLLFNIPEPISPIYEPSKLTDNNTTLLQDEMGQFSNENEQIINVSSTILEHCQLILANIQNVTIISNKFSIFSNI
jgi:hypothetical protein